jgi:hypothetical protein
MLADKIEIGASFSMETPTFETTFFKINASNLQTVFSKQNTTTFMLPKFCDLTINNVFCLNTTILVKVY